MFRLAFALKFIVNPYTFHADPATVISGTQDFIKNETFTARFTCVVEGIPRPNIIWSRANSTEANFKDLSNSTNITILELAELEDTNQNRITTTLEVRSLIRENDEGRYRCLAVNSVANFIQASDRFTTFLTVHGE